MSSETIKRLRDAHAAWMKKHPEYDIIDAVNEAAARIAALEATLARKQRAIDAAMSARRSGMNAGSIADILRPEATDAKLNEAGGDSIAKRVDALERLTQELASAHCATFPPDQRIVGLVKRLADPVLRCCLQLNNEYKARDFVGTHAERSLLCNAIDECQAIIAECEPGGDTNRDALSRSEDRAVRLVRTLAEIVVRMSAETDHKNDALLFRPDIRNAIQTFIAECDGGAK